MSTLALSILAILVLYGALRLLDRIHGVDEPTPLDTRPPLGLPDPKPTDVDWDWPSR